MNLKPLLFATLIVLFVGACTFDSPYLYDDPLFPDPVDTEPPADDIPDIAPRAAGEEFDVLSFYALDIEPPPTYREPEFVEGSLLVSFAAGVSAENRQNIVRRFGAEIAADYPDLLTVISVPPQAQEAIMQALSNSPLVDYVARDEILEVELYTNDPYLLQYREHESTQYRTWHLRTTRVFDAWRTSIGSAPVIVAAPDTGIDVTHEDIAGVLRMDLAMADVIDNNGHGTAAQGSLGVMVNNSLGIATPLWTAQVVPTKVAGSDDGRASSSALFAAADHALQNGARIISLSWGAGSCPVSESSMRSFDSFGAKLREQNDGLLFNSAGNSNCDVTHGPYRNVIVVGASSSLDRRSGFSNYGDFLDILAPGSTIATTRVGSTYGPWSGTSAASPVAASIAAYLWSVYPDLTASQIEQALYDGAVDLGPPGWDREHGHGRIDALGSLMALGGVYIPDTKPPVISNAQPSGVLPAGTTSVILTVNLDEPAKCAVRTSPGIEYSETSPNVFSSFHMRGNNIIYNGSIVRWINITNLRDDTTYTRYIRCKDDYGNVNTVDYVVSFSVGESSSTCGDGIITPPEQCDGSNLGGTTCASLGFTAGTLSCTSQCTFDTSACTLCGNSVCEQGETATSCPADCACAGEGEPAKQWLGSSACCAGLALSNGMCCPTGTTWDGQRCAAPPPANDTTPPTVSFMSPQSGATLSCNERIVVAASDESGISRVELRIGGTVVGTSGPRTDGEYPFFLDITGYADADYVLEAFATDSFGNNASAQLPIRIAKDLSAPRVTISAPQDGSVIETTSFTVLVNDNGNVENVDFFMNGVFLGTDTDAPFTWTINTTEGPMLIEAIGTSCLDTWSSDRISVSGAFPEPVDTTPPNVTITAPRNGDTVSGTVTISASAGDDVGVVSVSFLRNGVLIGDDTTHPYSVSWDTTAVSDGPYSLTARARDAAGNEREHTIGVTVRNVIDVSPPDVTIVSPTDGSSLPARGNIRFEAQASSSHGISTLDIYINAVLVRSCANRDSCFVNWNTGRLSPGEYVLTAVGVDTMGRASETSITVIR